MCGRVQNGRHQCGRPPPNEKLTHPPSFTPTPGTPSDALAALKLDTGAFLTAHMASRGVDAAGEEPNMLEEEVSGDDDAEGRLHAAAAAAGKRKRGKARA